MEQAALPQGRAGAAADSETVLLGPWWLDVWLGPLDRHQDAVHEAGTCSKPDFYSSASLCASRPCALCSNRIPAEQAQHVHDLHGTLQL